MKILLLLLSLFLMACKKPLKVKGLKTFGTMGKELTILRQDKEVELFSYKGKGCITHMWFGGNLYLDKDTTIRIYIDGEEKPSIDMALYMGHGIGFGDETPWGTERMGNIGGHSGLYNTYKVPFGKSIRITGQLSQNIRKDIREKPAFWHIIKSFPFITSPFPREKHTFWWIIRGTENLPLIVGGVELPEKARLKLHKLENYTAEPLEEFTMCDVSGKGMLYQVAMQAKGLTNTKYWKDLSYMESCIRYYQKNKKKPIFLSSGLEDYFFGTYYFNKGRYINMCAGLTHIDKAKKEFSAYRLHEEDPVFFQNGLRLTNRCGEKIGNKIFHAMPPRTTYTTYVWLYQW